MRDLVDAIETWTAAKQLRPRPFNWSDDGCSFIRYAAPGDAAFFHDACLRHDFGYRNYGNGLRLQRDDGTKQQIDNKLLDDMDYICDTRVSVVERPECYARAQYTYEGVYNLGGPAFYGDD